MTVSAPGIKQRAMKPLPVGWTPRTANGSGCDAEVMASMSAPAVNASDFKLLGVKLLGADSPDFVGILLYCAIRGEPAHVGGVADRAGVPSGAVLPNTIDFALGCVISIE